MALEDITFVGGHKNTATSGTSLAVTRHTNVAEGDFILFTASADGSTNSITLPSGFTSVFNGEVPSSAVGAIRLAFGYKIAEASEASDYTATFGLSDALAVSCLVWRGVSPTTPIDVSFDHATTDSTSADLPPCPSVTTVTDKTAVVTVVSQARGPGSGTMDTENFYTPPSGTTKVIDSNVSAGTGYAGHGVGWDTHATAGASGTRAWVNAIPYTQGGFGGTIALRPATSAETRTGSGELVSQAAGVDGAGVAFTVFTGSGATAAQTAQFNGTGHIIITGSASLIAQNVVVIGTATKGSDRVAVGALQAGSAEIDGVANLVSVVVANVALVAGPTLLAGIGTKAVDMRYITSECWVRTSEATSSLAVPAGATERDLILAVITCDGSGSAVSLPTGFTQIFNGNVPHDSVGATKLALGYRVLDGTEPELLEFSKSLDENASISMSVFRNVDREQPLDVATVHNVVTTGSNSSTLPACPSLTTVTEGAYLLSVVAQSRGALAVNMQANFHQPPAGVTEILDCHVGAGTYYTGHAVGYEPFASPGATGIRQWSTIYNSGGIAFHLALKPDTDPKTTHVVTVAVVAEPATTEGFVDLTDVGGFGVFVAQSAQLSGLATIFKKGSVNFQASLAQVTGAGVVTESPRIAAGALQAEPAQVVVDMDNLRLTEGEYNLEFVQLGWWVTNTATLVLEPNIEVVHFGVADLEAEDAQISIESRLWSRVNVDLQVSNAEVTAYVWIEHHPDDDPWVQHPSYWNE